MSVKVIAHPTTGLVITPSVNNPEFGTFRVDSEESTFTNGFHNISKRTAFVRGKLIGFESLNLSANKVLQGKIVKQESFQPFYEGQEAKINPSNGEIVLTNGRETYLQYNFTQDMNMFDNWVGSQEEQITEQVADALQEQDV